MEYRVATGMIRQRDFREGVRAAIIDKDHSPRCSLQRLARSAKLLCNPYSSRLLEAIFSSGILGPRLLHSENAPSLQICHDEHLTGSAESFAPLTHAKLNGRDLAWVSCWLGERT